MNPVLPMPPLERYLTRACRDDAGTEDPAATRERLRERFPRGATRRMTQLGMLVGATLLELEPSESDTVIYGSRFAETRALEAFLESFPAASPTLFQTSIHPSAVQQALIGRQQPIGEFLPITGDAELVAQLLLAALLAPAERVLLAGGEERGTWLLEQGVASARSFGFALALSRASTGALARLTYDPNRGGSASAPPSLEAFFDGLGSRENLVLPSPGGGHLTWQWA